MDPKLPRRLLIISAAREREDLVEELNDRNDQLADIVLRVCDR